jgi:flagellin-like protein
MGRGTSPVIGVVILLGLVIVGAAAVGGSLASIETPTDPVDITLSVAADSDRLTLTHRRGPPLNVSAASVAVRIDESPLVHQPPVPFFTARGFRAGPTGPFNSAADDTWRAGEETSLQLAATNAPLVAPGDVVRVRIATDEQTVAARGTAA